MTDFEFRGDYDVADMKVTLSAGVGVALKAFPFQPLDCGPIIGPEMLMLIRPDKEHQMKILTLAIVASCIALPVGFSQDAQAASKQQQCQEYARNAARATPTTTGAARGAARGAVAGAVLGGNAGKGAAAGAVVGGTRKAVQKTRSYDYYYNACMRG